MICQLVNIEVVLWWFNTNAKIQRSVRNQNPVRVYNKNKLMLHKRQLITICSEMLFQIL